MLRQVISHKNISTKIWPELSSLLLQQSTIEYTEITFTQCTPQQAVHLFSARRLRLCGKSFSVRGYSGACDNMTNYPVSFLLNLYLTTQTFKLLREKKENPYLQEACILGEWLDEFLFRHHHTGRYNSRNCSVSIHLHCGDGVPERTSLRGDGITLVHNPKI